VFLTLPQSIQDELQQLTTQYGAPEQDGQQALPLVRAETIRTGGKFDPLSKTDRYGEVCMVVRRKNGRLLTMTKTYYPQHSYRLLTGGINHGEGVLHALLRETREETGLDVSITRFLVAVSYSLPEAPEHPIFYTFAFLLNEQNGILESLDEDEKVENFREITPAELPTLAQHLDHLNTSFVKELVGQWNEWGQFRAIIHRLVYEALR
jgi:ADP-ribose pyrophosphatase